MIVDIIKDLRGYCKHELFCFKLVILWKNNKEANYGRFQKR